MWARIGALSAMSAEKAGPMFIGEGELDFDFLAGLRILLEDDDAEPDIAEHPGRVELRLPIGFWFLAAQIVARDSAKPDGVVEIETCADFIEPFEESVLLGCLFF